MAQGLDWQRDGRDWPHRNVSRFVQAADVHWHVQIIDAKAGPAAPVVLLLHGTGASTHSWRALMPLLAERCHVVAVDLPGHGFTGMPVAGALSRQFTLPGMAAALGVLLRVLPLPAPSLLIGHSAGAAVAVRMSLDRLVAPRAIVSLNGAFLPLGGVAGRVLSPVAKLAAVLPGVPALFSRRASEAAVLQRLVDGTGSVLDAEGVAFYARLAGNAGHVAGALAMMANWDLTPPERDLPRLAPPLTLMVGSADRTIRPAQAQRVRALLPQATLLTLDGLGHLAHEEQPQRIADAVLQAVAGAHAQGAMTSRPGK